MQGYVHCKTISPFANIKTKANTVTQTKLKTDAQVKGWYYQDQILEMTSVQTLEPNTQINVETDAREVAQVAESYSVQY